MSLWELGEVAKRVQVVFVTIDPERDTPERLRSYTAAFDPSFVGLTEGPEQLAQVRQAYGVVAEKQVVSGTSAQGYPTEGWSSEDRQGPERR